MSKRLATVVVATLVSLVGLGAPASAAADSSTPLLEQVRVIKDLKPTPPGGVIITPQRIDWH